MRAADDLQLPSLPAVAGDGAVVVAFSGGLDSTVLLHLLGHDAAVRRRGLRALHVHHGLQPGADDWVAHCTRACAALGLALQVLRVDVDHGNGLGPEGAARSARYRAFAGALAPGEIIALAHHQDDQAETFLLRALRASGVHGLAAMRPLRAFAAGMLWRPLLDVPRERLLRHARQAGLAWLDDPSNASADADRNYLRLHVLPILRARWAGAASALGRSASLAAEATDLLDMEDAALLSDVAGPAPATLAVDALRALPRPRRARVLRRWTAQLGLPPLPMAGVEAIERDLLAATRADGQAAFAWSGARVERWRGLLHAGTDLPPLAAGFRSRWDGRGRCLLPTGDALELAPSTAHADATTTTTADADAAGDAKPPWTVQARQGGERIVLPGRQHSHALKHVLQALGVPPWERRRMPLLVGGDGRLLAVGDAVVSAGFAAWLAGAGQRLVWRRQRGTGATAGDVHHGAHAGLP